MTVDNSTQLLWSLFYSQVRYRFSHTHAHTDTHAHEYAHTHTHTPRTLLFVSETIRVGFEDACPWNPAASFRFRVGIASTGMQNA